MMRNNILKQCQTKYPSITIKDSIIHEGLNFIEEIIGEINDESYNIQYLQEGYSDSKFDYFNNWSIKRTRILNKIRSKVNNTTDILINIMNLESDYDKDSEDYKVIIDKFSDMRFEAISIYDDVNGSNVEILVFLNEPGKKLLERIKEKNSTSEDTLLREEIERVTCEKMGIDYDDYHQD